tara:strand:- start:2537 stop:2776 length:240 start_codon:yes stop_codon:yes gene_type:complete
MFPNDLLASIRPINPSAFGNVAPQQPQQPQQPQMAPQGQMPQGGDQMTDYLMNKVEEIKRRLGQGDMGALSNVSDAMRG